MTTLTHLRTSAQQGDTSPLQAFRIAGVANLVLFIVAVFANFFVMVGLVVPGEVATTISNISANIELFRVGLVAWVLVLVCDVILGWGLHVLLKPINQSLSLLAAWFRMLHAAVYGAALFTLGIISLLLTRADYATLFDTADLHRMVTILLDGYGIGFLIGLLFFSFHLLIAGYLIVKSGIFSKTIGIFLLIAGATWLVHSSIHLIAPEFASASTPLELLVMTTMVWEGGLMVWLLWRGFGRRSPDIRPQTITTG